MTKQKLLTNLPSNNQPKNLVALLFFLMGAIHVYSRITRPFATQSSPQTSSDQIIADSKEKNTLNSYVAIALGAALIASLAEFIVIHV